MPSRIEIWVEVQNDGIGRKRKLGSSDTMDGFLLDGRDVVHDLRLRHLVVWLHSYGTIMTRDPPDSCLEPLYLRFLGIYWMAD